MNVSAFDLNHVKALHFLLEEAHVGRAAARLGITPAAASNALRRLRDEVGDPLLVKKGRGLVRTRMGEELRAPARAVVDAAARLLRASRPFDPAAFAGHLPIALADHVAFHLLPTLDELVRVQAPHAILAIAPIPMATSEWLEQTGGVLVTPAGAFAAIGAGDSLQADDLYKDRYVCVMRRGHPALSGRWDTATYAKQGHVVVLPRGRTHSSDIDAHLAAKGLSRRVLRFVPSFALSLPLVERSDLIATMPERSVRRLTSKRLETRPLPFRLPALDMKMVVHPAHANDGRTEFIRRLLRAAVRGRGRQEQMLVGTGIRLG